MSAAPLLRCAAALAVLVGLAACGEKPQQGVTAAKKSDGKPWDGGNAAYTADGWTAGDKASWEQQLKARAAKQNEYARVR